MSKIAQRFLPILFLFGTVIAVTSEGADHNALDLVADPWCPFTCEPGGPHQGLMVDVVKEAFAIQGYKIDYNTVNWARAIEETRGAKHTAIVGALKGDAPDFVFPKNSFTDQKSCFYRLKGGTWKYDGTESLKGISIGLVNDYKYGEPFDAWVEQQKTTKSKSLDFVSGVGTSEKLFLKLQEKRSQVIIEDESVVSYLAAQPKNSIAKVPFEKVGCLEKQPLYIAFSPTAKDSAALAEAFDQGFQKLVASKKLDQIRKRYFGATGR